MDAAILNQDIGRASTQNDIGGLMCLTCDSKTWHDCITYGVKKRCAPNQTRCQIEERKRRGKVESIHMGCKQAEACQNNKKNNFMGNWFAWQCHPGERYKGPSVCRQCCKTEHCGGQLIGISNHNFHMAFWKRRLD